jgi:predicted transcriptional regulator
MVILLYTAAGTAGMSNSSSTQVDTKQARLEHPSGLLYLTRNESVPILLDALLDLPPDREFNKTELASHAGLTRQTVGSYIDRLLEVEILRDVPETSPQRYRVTESDVVRELYAFNSALNAARDG